MGIVYKDIWGHDLEFCGFTVVPFCLNKYRDDDCKIFDVRGYLANPNDYVWIDGVCVDDRLIANFTHEEDAFALKSKLELMLDESYKRGCLYGSQQ